MLTPKKLTPPLLNTKARTATLSVALPTTPVSTVQRNNIIVIIIPLRYVREYIAIDFIGSAILYATIKKISLVNWIAFAGSYAGSIAIRLLVMGYRRFQRAQVQITPFSSLFPPLNDVPQSPIE